MFAVPDALAGFYLACFLLGLAFVLVSALVGLGHDILHLPGVHVHGGDGGVDALASAHHAVSSLDVASGHDVASEGSHAAGGHVGTADDSLAHQAGDRGAGAKVWASPFNLMTAMAFLTWFGAAGYILHAVLNWWPPLTLLLALIPGLLAAWLVFLFLVKILLPGTLPGDASDREVLGQLGKISLRVPAGGVGEVVYTLEGSRHSDGATSVDGLEIPEGTEVVIVGFEKGIAQVEPYVRYRQVKSGKEKSEG